MPLTLEEYVERLDQRKDLPWPVAPKIDPPKAKPSLHAMPVKAVFWTVYGTLVAIPQGELLFEHPQPFVTDAALDKLIKEFKMWQSMSRKPGAPAEYMKELVNKALTTLRLTGGGGGEKFPEVQAERVWEDIVKKLQQKEYTFDAITYGSIGDYVKKIAYFYHASIQGAGPYPNAADALQLLAERGIVQGLLADGQCFTAGQLQRCLKQQDPDFDLNAVVAPASCTRSIPSSSPAHKAPTLVMTARIVRVGWKTNPRVFHASPDRLPSTPASSPSGGGDRSTSATFPVAASRIR